MKFKQQFPELTEQEFKGISTKTIPEAKMGATRIYFVRHGTSEGKNLNLAGGGLNFHKLVKKGQEESQTLGEKFLSNNISFSAVVSSGAAAAIETAAIVAGILKIKNEQDFRLNQKHWGHSHGKVIDTEYKESRKAGEKKTDSLPTFYEKMNFRFDDGITEEEPLLKVFDRTLEFLKQVSQDASLKGKNVMAITHTPITNIPAFKAGIFGSKFYFLEETRCIDLIRQNLL